MADLGLTLVLILITIGAASISQVLLKIGLKGRLKKVNLKSIFKVLFTPLVFTGMALYAITAVLWVVILSQAELSYAYPFMATSYGIVAVLSYLVLKEKIKPLRLAGIIIIIVGVVLVGLSRV